MTITLDDIRTHLRRTDPDGHGDRSYAVPLVDAMEERAQRQAAYAIDLSGWLDIGGTVLLRDVLAAPFKDAPFVAAIQGPIDEDKHPYAWDDIWMAVDSARHALSFQEGIAPAATEEAPTAPADEAPEGCDSRLSPCGTYMIHEHDCPEAIEHGWPRENAPGAQTYRMETTSENIARDMREGRFPKRSEPKQVPLEDPDLRTKVRKRLHEVIVNAVAEALQMRGDGTGDHMQGLLSMHPAPKTDPRDNDAIWAAFYRDGKTLGDIVKEFGLSSVYDLTPWLTAPLVNAPNPDVRARAEEGK